MQKENLNLKRSLIMQSFAPLFLLLTIKHFNVNLYWGLICRFIDIFAQKGAVAFSITIKHASFGGFVISVMGICWLLFTIIIALGFNGMQEAGFIAAGEKIEIENEPNDSGATFLVSYVLPLLSYHERGRLDQCPHQHV